jgi:hypothetical protein
MCSFLKKIYKRQRLNLANDDGTMLSERIVGVEFYELWGLCQMKVVEQTNSFVAFNVAHIVMLKCAQFTGKMIDSSFKEIK